MRSSTSNELSAKMGGQFLSPSSFGTSMTLAETLEEAVFRVASIQAMSIEDLSVFFYSKEGQSEVKESIVIENEVIRSVAIIGFGKLLLLAWERSSNCDIEKFLRFSSLSEARRMKDDFMDFTSEVLGSFALGVVGRATASDPLQLLEDVPSCVGAYSEVLSELYHQFNSKIFEFDTAIDNMLGIDDLETCRTKSSYDAISWIPFIRRVTGGLLCSGGHFLLIERWHQMSSCYEYSRLLSQLFLFLLGNGAIDQNSKDGSVASVVLDWAALSNGRAGGGSFDLVSSLGSGGSGESYHTSVRVHRVAEEWICILQQQMASVNVYHAAVSVGEALSFCHVSCGLPEEVKSQVCVCVVKHTVRLLRISERMRRMSMRPSSAEDEEAADFLLNPSLRLHLMACMFYAARNPYRPPDSSSVDLSFIFETLCSFSESDVTQTMLVTHGVSLLLYPPRPPSTTSSSSSSSSTFIEQRLQLVFTHPFILSVLGPAPSKTQQTFRCRFIAAICIGMEKLITETVNTVNSILSECDSNLTDAASNTLEVAAVDLMNMISCLPLIADAFGKCLYWGIGGFDGESGPLSLVSLISCAASVILPLSTSTSSSSSSPTNCTPLSLNWESLLKFSTPQANSETFPTLQLLHSAFLELQIEIDKTFKLLFTLLKGGWNKKSNESFSIGACVELAYVMLLHHTPEQVAQGAVEGGGGVGTSTNTGIKAVSDEKIKFLSGLLKDILLGTVKAKGKGQGQGSSGQANADSEGHVASDAALLPGGRTLGQRTQPVVPLPSATTSSTPTSASSTASTADVQEVLNMIEDLVAYADPSVTLIICDMVKDIVTPLNALGSVLQERVELLLLRLPRKNLLSLMKHRAPMQCNIVSLNPEKRSSSAPQYLTGRRHGQGHGHGRGWGRREEDKIEVEEASREKGDKGSKKVGSSKVTVSYVNTANTFNQIFSVFDVHFRQEKETELERGRNRGMLKSSIYDPLRSKQQHICSASGRDVSVSEEDVWVQVSGSGDLLTVLATTSSTEKRAASQNSILIPVRVIVTNSSGFKIPAFSIDMILLTADRCIASSPLSAHLATVLPSGNASTLIGTDSLVEYLLPGSTVEKTFHILVRHVCSVEAVVRLSYPDLTEEEIDSGDAFFTCPHTVKLSRGSGGRSGVITADTDCAPYHIGVWSFLHQYRDAITAFRACDGGNSSSSSPSANEIMRGAASAEQRMKLNSCDAGLPYETFSSLWHSLPFSAVIHEGYRVAGQGAGQGVQGNERAGVYRVDLPASCTSPSSSSFSMAWVMNTLWGCSVAVRADSVLTDEVEGLQGADNPISGSQGLKMRMTVRCSDKDTFKAILADTSHFLDAFL